MLYVKVLKTYAIAAPGASMAPFHAREMIKIIMSKNHELGSELHEMAEKKMLLLDDRLVLKEAQSWMDRKATSFLGSR